jgi:cyclic pyranopterin phosphate synthase
MELTHVDDDGGIQMVDVGDKVDTVRVAVARGEVRMKPETLRLIAAGNAPKGDVLTTAQLAGIMGAKRTHELIPLCHPLPLTKVDVEFEIDEARARIEITATARCTGKTGVEMEALTAVSVAALTIYDMAKAVEKTMRIGEIRLVQKRGGKSGEIILE